MVSTRIVIKMASLVFTATVWGSLGAFSPGIIRPQSPPRGWRSWNKFQCNINQSVIEVSFGEFFWETPFT